ncbi:hypothetical protein [Oceanobacillus rekensis]|uniref:hypothetical protein n=1 Tax=Oceanobacillus rekensis TaxID=937927 RepID=UPI000B450BEC|nr:hypothetical protein [Oceanobacillus rekensis]
MNKCFKCNHEQDSGKFCELCGTTMGSDVPAGVQVKQETAASVASNVPIQQSNIDAKTALKDFGAYFMRLLKNPSAALSSNENLFLNGLINIAIYVIALAIGLYLLINSVSKAAMGFGSMLGSDMNVTIPFFAIVFRVIFITLIFIAISWVSTLAMSKLGKSTVTSKELIAQFGGLLTPFIAINILGLLAGLAGSIPTTLTLMSLSLFFVTFILPVVLVSEKVKNTSNQKVYIALGSSALAMFISYIIIRSIIFGMIEDLESLTSFL